MSAKTLMVQGTSSSAGKSLLVAGLCRLLKQEGYRVAPFKAQNMALNAAVTAEGLEIGRATAVQAEAAGIEPTVDMNPILLKPEADSRCQVVVLGRPTESLPAHLYYQRKAQLWATVCASLDRLREMHDVVVIEGAGSPAEVNLRESDLVNMRVARYANAPVLLVGDIDRGGVFASLVGTLELLEPEERSLVRGLVVNKFRGDISLLESGLRFLEKRTGRPVVGVVPYLRDLLVSEEDSVALDSFSATRGLVDIAVIRLPRIANFDDFDLLAAEPPVGLRYVDDPARLGRPDLVILPGSKGTVGDLAFLRESGLARAILALADTGTPVLGICGGYQMMGERILDPAGVESARKVTEGLGLLPATTTFLPHKRTVKVEAEVLEGSGPFARAAGQRIQAYEIHMGTTEHSGSPAFRLVGRASGIEALAPRSQRRAGACLLPPRLPGRQETSPCPRPSNYGTAHSAGGAPGPAKASIPGGQPLGGGEGLVLRRSGDDTSCHAEPQRSISWCHEEILRFAQDDNTVDRSVGGSLVLDGCVARGGLAVGSYLHGLFENRCLRRALVDWLVERRGLPPISWQEEVSGREASYDRLADCLRRHLDLPALWAMMGLRG